MLIRVLFNLWKLTPHCSIMVVKETICYIYLLMLAPPPKSSNAITSHHHWHSNTSFPNTKIDWQLYSELSYQGKEQQNVIPPAEIMGAFARGAWGCQRDAGFCREKASWGCDHDLELLRVLLKQRYPLSSFHLLPRRLRTWPLQCMYGHYYQFLRGSSAIHTFALCGQERKLEKRQVGNRGLTWERGVLDCKQTPQNSFIC